MVKLVNLVFEKDTVYIYNQMEKDLMDIGKMGYLMEKEFKQSLMEKLIVVSFLKANQMGKAV